MVRNSALRWGIVSTGRIAEQFCQDMSFVSNGTLAAVAARSIDDAKEFANKFNIDKAYQGYQALFNDPDIDIVYIGTPHNFHYQNVYDALMAGKSVLCEKPITVSSDESKKLSLLAKEKGLFLMEAMWTYFLPAIIKAKQWVNEGKIGNIKHIKADFGYPMPYKEEGREYDKALAGGCLLDMGIYPIAIAHYFTEQPMEGIQLIAHFAPNGVEDDVVIIAHADEIKLSLSTSFQCKLPNWAYIIGDKGYIAIPDFWRASQCFLYESDDLVNEFNDNRKSLGLNYEAQAAGEAVLLGALEHEKMPHATSHALQQQMENIKSLF